MPPRPGAPRVRVALGPDRGVTTSGCSAWAMGRAMGREAIGGERTVVRDKDLTRCQLGLRSQGVRRGAPWGDARVPEGCTAWPTTFGSSPPIRTSRSRTSWCTRTCRRSCARRSTEAEKAYAAPDARGQAAEGRAGRAQEGAGSRRVTPRRRARTWARARRGRPPAVAGESRRRRAPQGHGHRRRRGRDPLRRRRRRVASWRSTPRTGSRPTGPSTPPSIEWASVDPKRLMPVYILPINDIKASVKEVERVVAEHGKAVQVPLIPREQGAPPYWDEYYDPLWEVLSDTGVPISQHVGANSYLMQRRHARGPDAVQGHPPVAAADLHVGVRRRLDGQRCARALARPEGRARRGRHRLDPLLPRAARHHGRQPRLGHVPRPRPSRRSPASTGTGTWRPPSSRTSPASACSTSSASRTSCGRPTTRTPTAPGPAARRS